MAHLSIQHISSNHYKLNNTKAIINFMMTSTPPLDDWESVGNEEHLDVKELKSQIYDLKQKLTLADARESTLLKDKKDIQTELDDTKKKVSVLEEMNSKQKLELLSLDAGEKNLVLLKEEIERSGRMKVEMMQMKQTIKEQESLEGMLNAKTKELHLAKKKISIYSDTISQIEPKAVYSASYPSSNKSRLESIQKIAIECKNIIPRSKGVCGLVARYAVLITYIY